jgi:predicted GNAT family N-acyltransferase
MMKNFTEHIRIAETKEKKRAIYAFRYRVYIEEMGKPYKNADHENKLLTDELDDCATLLYVEENDEITGTVRINWGCEEKVMQHYRECFSLDCFREYPNNFFSFCSRLMVSQDYRKTKLAVNLSERAYLEGRKRKVLFNFLSCAPTLTPFFERLGYRRYKPDFHECGAGIQVSFVGLLEDLQRFQETRSPFLKEAVKWENSAETRHWFASQPHFLQTRELQTA